MQFINNWSQPVTLAAGATELALDLPDGTYRLTLTEKLAGGTRWEIVDAVAQGGQAMLTRAREGTEEQEWPEGSVIYCATTAGVLEELAARIAALESAAGGGGDGLTKENFVELVPSGYLGMASNEERGGLHVFNRKDIGCLFYGSLTNYLAVAPVYEVGVGPRTSFGLYPSWALGAAQCSYVYTVTGAGPRAVMGLVPPPGDIGELRLSASSFGSMYNEIPAVDFGFTLELTVPALAGGDFMAVEFRIAGLSTISLELDPVSRVWTAGGTSLGTQGEYRSQISVTPGPINSSGHPDTALIDVGEGPIEIAISPDAYAETSGIFVSCRTAAGSVIEVGRVDGHVTYGHYA